VLLSQIRLSGASAQEDLILPLDDERGAPRRLVVLYGGDGVGKTSILAAIAATRPGHAVVQTARPGGPPAFAVADWILGDDDPARPHRLRVLNPNARLEAERDEEVVVRRREQTLFDRRAAEGGFAFTSFSGARWFSRAPVLLAAPARTWLRHDVRAAVSFDDATHADLTRETKQVLAFAGIAAALARSSGAEPGRFDVFAKALREVLAALLEDTGVELKGIDSARLEPTFDDDGRSVELDELPRRIRHRIAFGALALRTLAAAYPDKDPREAEGVILIDDIESQQDLASQAALPALLRRALPRVQWIVSTSSPAVVSGCDASWVLALRRMTATGPVEIHQGAGAVMH
jgi:hypothetical protein